MHLRHAIRDPIHGFIRLSDAEIRGIDTRELQRLRMISQLGLTERIFPGARHSRFEHALGALEVATRILEELRSRLGLESLLGMLELPASSREFEQVLTIARWSALLHDIGHAPFSHVTESLLPITGGHEALTSLLLEHGEIHRVLVDCGAHVRDAVERVLDQQAERDTALDFVNAIITGAVGADRMDYLLRDSTATGVSYGIFDLGRVLETLHPAITEDGVELGIRRGGELAVEGMMWARFSMFQQVYYHATRRILDRHLNDFLEGSLEGGVYPADPDEYLEWNDARIWELLRRAARDPQAAGHADARRILAREHHRCLRQELESTHVDRLERWLYDWGQQVVADDPDAAPIADLILPPPAADSGLKLRVIERDGSSRTLAESSALIGRLKLLPRGRLYVAPGHPGRPFEATP